MAFRSFHFYDNAGAPLTGLTPTLTYVDRTGAAVLPVPTVTDLGGGAYGVVVPSVDETTGVVLLMDGGATATPRWQVETAAIDGLFAFLLRNLAGGALYTGVGTPTIPLYVDASAVPRTPPALTHPNLPVFGAQQFLWIATASASDIAAGTAARIDSPADAAPAHLTAAMAAGASGSSGTPPVVTNISPAAGTAIGAAQSISFDVTDDSGLFRLIMVIADFGLLAIREVIHDGMSFGPRYLASGNGRVAIPGGWHYTVLRQGGWPSSPTITPYAIDLGGGENP